MRQAKVYKFWVIKVKES